MLAAIENWEISEESASDHNIIKFNLKIEEDEENIIKTPELRYIIKEHQRRAFYENFYNAISKEFQLGRNEGQAEIDDILSRRLKGELELKQFTEKLEDVIQTTCRETCRIKELFKPQKNKGKDGALVDKRITSNEEKDKRLEKTISTDNNQRSIKRKQESIQQSKGRLPNRNKKEKTRSWKEYCTLTSANTHGTKCIK